MINLSDIKSNLIQKEVRKKFKIGKNTVEVYSIKLEDVEKLYEYISDLYDEEKGEFIVENAETVKYIYETFTNIKIDDSEELMEILRNPNSKLLDIQREISKSMIEVVNTYLKDRLVELESVELAISTQDLKNKGEEMIKKYGLGGK